MDTPHGPIVTADELCQRVEAVLREHLPPLLKAADLKPIVEWQQVPTEAALSTANLPAAAITTPGLAEPPTRDIRGVNFTWRLVAGVYDRGTSYADTARRTRTWAALLRTVLVQHLADDLIREVRCAGEEYALQPEKDAARTLGGCAVAIDVDVRTVTRLPGRTTKPC